MADVVEGSIITDQETMEQRVISTGDNAADIAVDSAADNAADIAADSAADIAADSAADIAANSAADIAGDSAADIAGDSAADIAADIAGDSAADIAADSASITSVVNKSDGTGNDGISAAVKDSEEASVKKEANMPNVPENRGAMVADKQEQSVTTKMEDEDHDFLSEDFMDNLDVVDSWVDTADNVESPCNELNATTDSLITSQTADVNFDTKEVSQKDSEKCSTNKDVTNTKDNVSKPNEKSSRRGSQDKKANEKDGKSTDKSNVHDKKTISKEPNEQSRNRNSDRTGKSPGRTFSRERDNRREKSPGRSNKSSDVARRNADRGNTSFSSRTRRNSRTRRSRTRSRERDEHYNSRKNQKERSAQPRGSRTSSLSWKQDKDKRSVKSQSSSGKEVGLIKPNLATTGKNADVNPLLFKKIPPLLDILVPPGTEDEVLTKVDEKFSPHFLTADALVPPGTEEVLLPDALAQNSSSSKKRKASNSDLNKSRLKSGTERDNSENGKEKRGTEKRRRTTSTGVDDTLRKKQPLVPKRELTGRERVSRDQDRMSRELSLERFRESRNRDREERDRTLRDRGRHWDRYGHNHRSREERDKRSPSFERRSSHDSRRETSGRNRFERRSGELSPVSPGRMSKDSPMSFEFSPVSSRSSSRERLKPEYGRNVFRSFSPISSGSNLSRSMVSISSDEERDPRSGRRRRRLPFLDEMERKLGLKLTGGHNINQKLRASRHFPMDFNPGIDVSAPPPGTYPVSYPPLVSYTTPFPQAVNPMYPTPARSLASILQSFELPVVRNIGQTLVTCGAKPSPSSQPERQLVKVQQTPLNISFKFQRSFQNELPECPNAPTISGGTIKGEMSLSSLLEASVKAGAKKNPVDECRVQRCQVAIQTLQEDESFSMITMGRFVVQPAAKDAAYSPVARFDHPAQESMFKLKSPLLRNRPVALAFTTPPAAPYKEAAVSAPKPASLWPKNSEKKPAAPAPAPPPVEEEEDGDPDVWIVERTETVVSISSESEGERPERDLELSPVSDASEDKLENVSSGEEDFNNQCATCSCREKKKKTVATQYRSFPARRTVSLQVDLVDQRLVGTCDVAPRPGRRRKKKNRWSSNPSIHSNTSSVSSCSVPNSPVDQTRSSPLNPARPVAEPTTSRPTAKSFLASITDTQLTGSTDQLYGNLPSPKATNPSSYIPFSSTSNNFPNKSLQNQPPNSYMSQTKTGNNPSDIDSNKFLQANPNLPSLQSSSVALGTSFKSSGPFRSENAIKLTTINSGTMLGVLSKPAPTKGILKTSRPAEVQSTPASDQPPKFQLSHLFPGESTPIKATPFCNQSTKNQPSTAMPPFHAGNMPQHQNNPSQQQSFLGGNIQRQPFVGNTTNQNKQAISGQSFQGESMPRQPFVGNTTNQNKQAISGQSFQGESMPRQSFVGNTTNQNKQAISGQSFQGESMPRQSFVGNTTNQNKQAIGGQSYQGGNMSQQPFVGSTTNQNVGGPSFQGGNMPRQPFVGNTTNQNKQAIGGQSFQGGLGQPFVGNTNQLGLRAAPLHSYGSFAPQTMNANFSNRFSNPGNVPTMVPPPTPGPVSTYNQQNFQRPSEELGMNAGPAGINSDQRQTYFGSPSSGQHSNFFDRERY